MSVLVMTEVFAARFGTSNRKMVALRLADFADNQGRGMWPSVTTIARECEIAPRTVQRVLREFEDEGLIICQERGSGRRTSRYDYNMAKLRELRAAAEGISPDVNTSKAADEYAEGEAENGAGNEGCHGVTPDTDDMRGDTVSPLGCHGVTQSVMEPSIDPSTERERASADVPGVEGDEADGSEAVAAAAEKPDSSTVPETADFQKRVMRFCNGRGFDAGPWPDWDTSSPGWIGRQFAKLAETDRQHAERWRDAYLRDIATRRKKPVPVGTFFRDRLWEGLDPALLQRAQKAAEQGAKPAEYAKPEGWTVSMGPVWAACLAEVLLRGPEHGEHVPGNGVWLRFNMTKGWPKLAALYDLASNKRGLVLPERFHRMKDLVEFVPEGGNVWAAWEAEFKARNWPAWPRREGMDGMYFPVGGPDGLPAFERELAARHQTNEAAQ